MIFNSLFMFWTQFEFSMMSKSDRMNNLAIFKLKFSYSHNVLFFKYDGMDDASSLFHKNAP